LLIDGGPRAGLLLADAYLSVEPYALALRRGDEDFRLAIDRALSQIYRSREIVKLFAMSFGPTVQPSQILPTKVVGCASEAAAAKPGPKSNRRNWRPMLAWLALVHQPLVHMVTRQPLRRTESGVEHSPARPLGTVSLFYPDNSLIPGSKLPVSDRHQN
jgi:hypothetical protein